MEINYKNEKYCLKNNFKFKKLTMIFNFNYHIIGNRKNENDSDYNPYYLYT